MREGRDLRQGRIEACVGHDGTVAALVEVTCETDFVAKNKDFIAFARHCAEQLVAAPGTLAEGGVVDQRRAALSAQVGERIVIRRVVRYAIADAGGPPPGGTAVREPRNPSPSGGALDVEARGDASA